MTSRFGRQISRYGNGSGLWRGLAIGVKEIAPDLEALAPVPLRDEHRGQLVGDGDEGAFAQDQGRGRKRTPARFRGDDAGGLQVVVEPELAGMVLEDEENLLPAPDNG